MPWLAGQILLVGKNLDYIESHLYEKLDLETVARAVHYSKYHMHRMFTDTVGLTIIFGSPLVRVFAEKQRTNH